MRARGIHSQGSQVYAGEDLILSAGRDILLESATSTSHSSSLSISVDASVVSVSMSVSVPDQEESQQVRVVQETGIKEVQLSIRTVILFPAEQRLLYRVMTLRFRELLSAVAMLF